VSQYKVPQNIDMQDRIVGPLTLYQFLYLLGGGLVCYTTFKSGNMISFFVLGLPAFLLSLAFAFIKVNEQPFSHFFISYTYFMIHPKRRLWHHGSGTPTISLTEDKNSSKKRVVVKPRSRDDFLKVAKSLDGGQS
jgi:hypothetical protein